MIEESLAALVDRVEHDITPLGTNYVYHDGQVTLPKNAHERGGIQPVVAVTASGAPRADICAGDTVNLEVHAALALGAGKITRVEWDFDGSGTYPSEDSSLDGKATEVKLSATHQYGRPGTYFATARVTSHRHGDRDATHGRIPNLGQARIFVT
jgi:PKD domain-containing protein